MSEHKELSGELEFDVENLLGIAPKFAQAGGWVENAVQSATSELTGLGEFWGNDKAGQKFGAAYEEQQDKVLKILSMLSGELEGVADGIKKMAENYEITEKDIASDVPKLHTL